MEAGVAAARGRCTADGPVPNRSGLPLVRLPLLIFWRRRAAWSGAAPILSRGDAAADELPFNLAG